MGERFNYITTTEIIKIMSNPFDVLSANDETTREALLGVFHVDLKGVTDKENKITELNKSTNLMTLSTGDLLGINKPIIINNKNKLQVLEMEGTQLEPYKYEEYKYKYQFLFDNLKVTKNNINTWVVTNWVIDETMLLHNHLPTHFINCIFSLPVLKTFVMMDHDMPIIEGPRKMLTEFDEEQYNRIVNKIMLINVRNKMVAAASTDTEKQQIIDAFKGDIYIN
jgi:hypothetical protein